MIIIEQSATLEWATPNAEEHIERAGRVCYKSEDKITSGSAAKFVRMIYASGHHSVLEHASASIRFVCDRGVSHELVRHRLASYSQESTRYCNYAKKGGEIQVIAPPGHSKDRRWLEAMQHAERAYLEMLDLGVKPQLARSVLPTCLKTEIVMTANLREWLHVLLLRRQKRAHPQIRELMDLAINILHNVSPVLFDRT